MYKWTIERKTNKYNKYMKWHLLGIAENGSKSSHWYKTEAEAIKNKESQCNYDYNKYVRTV